MVQAELHENRFREREQKACWPDETAEQTTVNQFAAPNEP
jgi:hypothetical protein